MNFFMLNNQHLLDFKGNWGRFLIFGILLLALGVIVTYAAVLTTLISVTFLGVIILASGIVNLIDTITFWRGKWGGFFLHLIIAVLYIYVGVYMLQHPEAAAESLTLILGVFYLAAGACRVAFSSAMQAPQWGWSWFNGVVSMIIGILIISSWPASSLLIIGLFVGIDLIVWGWAYIMSALVARKAVV